MENLKTLQAMLLLAEALNYSTTYKEQLILELNYMIGNEQKKVIG